MTSDDVCSVAHDFACINNFEISFDSQKKKAGQDWLEQFLVRHPELSFSQPEATTLSRATGLNKPQVGKFFNLLKSIKAGDNIADHNIYNMVETGLSSIQKPSKVLELRGAKQVGKVTSAEKDKGNNKAVTALCVMNSVGCFVPPIFMYSRKRLLQTLLHGTPQHLNFFTLPSGWTKGKSL